MENKENPKQYDLEERTYKFAYDVMCFVKLLPRTITNIENVRQLVRSAGSVGANYIEANEALSRKDFLMRVKICRKEAKETIYWLRLLDSPEDSGKIAVESLIREATALMKIFGAIIEKTK
jgi:four helix bundle protein